MPFITSCIGMLLPLLIFNFSILSCNCAQVINSNNLPLPLLSGYGMDMCRYMSCPYGQQCLNGVCWSSSPLSTTTKVPTDPNSVSITRPSYAGYLNPLLTAYPWYTGIRPEFGGIGYERICPTRDNCLGIGQTCFHSGCFHATTTYNYGGMQPCSLTEQCIYGQICVDGFCLPSNVAQIGKQSQPLLISCSTGAPCPVGYYCMNGFCVRNALTSTFACSRGICPTGMTCFIGRCVSSSYIGK